MKTEYYIGTNKVSKEVYDTVQIYKKDNLLLAYENEKHKKAFEILKKKKVNVWTLLNTKTVAAYNFREVVVKPKRKLTEKEYNLLKEMLK